MLKGEKRKMIRNFRDIIILLITSGVLILLGVIIVGDYWVALEENRPVDESVITLMKMSVTGLIGVIGGYIGGRRIMIKEALIKKLEGDIAVAKADINLFMEKPIGVAEHIDYVATAEKKLEILATAEDKLSSLKNL